MIRAFGHRLLTTYVPDAAVNTVNRREYMVCRFHFL